MTSRRFGAAPVWGDGAVAALTPRPSKSIPAEAPATFLKNSLRLGIALSVNYDDEVVLHFDCIDSMQFSLNGKP
jgi:hypothetical protein